MAHLTLLLVLLWVGSTVSSVEDLHKRIIGGQPCTRDYHIYLKLIQGSVYRFCGGSLVSNQWILTAAHCWENGWTFHGYRLDSKGKTVEMEIEQKPVIYTDAKKQPHDLMLLKLTKPIDKSEKIPLVDPTIDCVKPHYPPKTVQVAGYAATSGNPDGTRKPGEVDILHCAVFQGINCERIEQILQADAPEFYKEVKHQHWLCAQTPKKDICKGDSGGGVVDKGKLYGVVSLLGDPHRVCKEPFAFMDLCNKEYNDWISKTIKG